MPNNRISGRSKPIFQTLSAPPSILAIKYRSTNNPIGAINPNPSHCFQQGRYIHSTIVKKIQILWQRAPFSIVGLKNKQVKTEIFGACLCRDACSTDGFLTFWSKQSQMGRRSAMSLCADCKKKYHFSRWL